MSKQNVVWLITKLIGVCFAYWTIVAFFVLISSISAYISLPSPPRFPKNENTTANIQTTVPGFPVNPTIGNSSIINPANNPAAQKAEAENPVQTAKNNALKQLLWDLFLFVIYGLFAWYLIRDGRILFAILNREAPFDESGEPVRDASFPLGKKKEQVVTTLDLSGGRREKAEEITPLNLSDAAASPASVPDLPKEPETPPVISAEEPLEIPHEAPTVVSNPPVSAEDAAQTPMLEDLAPDTLMEESKPDPADKRDEHNNL